MLENLKGKDRLEGLDGKMNNIKTDLKEIAWEAVHWMYWALEQKPVEVFCERSSELPDCMKGGGEVCLE
jgi:hypothetical protein